MPDLLLEFFSEEIPARMQVRAAEDLRKMVTDRLVAAGLSYEGAKAFVTPRRLALSVIGVPARQPDLKEERKGPKVGAPEQAIAGFLRAAGLKSVGEAKVQADKKGDFYVAVIDKTGRAAVEVIAEMIPEVVRDFPWPKSMRWGEQSGPKRWIGGAGGYGMPSGGYGVGALAYAGEEPALRWVRPLHSIVAIFGPETEEPEIVQFEVGGIKSGNTTRGHRFMAPDTIKVRRFDDYAAKLEAAKVVLDPARRAAMILADAKNLAFAQGYELIEDDGLLAEVAGLVEWPVTLMGSFDAAYLAIPEEVIRATIRNNQKCFVLRDAQTAKLANKFILVANEEASDGGKAIIAGNERVIRARLSDAKFFYETDRKIKLEARLPKFEQIIFHEKLGTQAERIKRITALAKELAPLVKADPKKAERAAQLCKTDLLTDVVGEFPELQGLMGKYYAEAQGEDEAVAHACEDHYKPKGPDDLVPSDPVSIAVALADKIDMLVGFWAIDEKPTGSKDPYALRRAGLGIIRLILDNHIRIRLSEVFADTLALRLIDGGVLIERALKTESQFSVRERIFKVLGAFPLLGAYLFDGSLEKEWLEIVIDEVESRSDSDEVNLVDLSQDTLLSLAEIIYGDNNDAKWPAKTVDEAKKKLSQIVERVENLAQFARLAPNSFKRGWVSQFVLGTISSDKNISSVFVPLFALTVAKDLLSFIATRLEFQLREQGARHDLIKAVFAYDGPADLLLIVRRVEALGKFLDTDDGKNLLAGVKRASNILRIEEKKDDKSYSGAPDAKLLKDAEEKALAEAVKIAKKEASAAVAKEDFAAAMSAMAKLRPKVDAFFEKVTVNVDDKAMRENRLKLLNEIREATRAVADFSKIEG